MAEEISFGVWLRKQRRTLDLTRQAFADQVGCAEVTLRRVEAGTLKPSKELAGLILEKIGISEAERPQWISFARGLSSIPPSAITAAIQPKPFNGRCPYKGLDVFEEEDAELFFGRERLVEDLIGRLRASRTLFIIGSSGSGKSSLVRAGLIHALKQGAIKGLHSERWLYETMKPGRDPLGELARVISSIAGTTNAGDEVQANALANEGILARWCEIALKDDPNKRAVLFIDQFEEIFTQVNNEEERLTFLNLLTHAATVENGRVIVLFAMRSDFVMNCAIYPKLNVLFNQQSIQVGAMEPSELANAIARPALNVGLRIDRDLIEEIIEDMQGEPGALPLMQFALKDLFDSEQAKGGMIDLTRQDYLEHGGIHRSLVRHADETFARLQDKEQELARSIFRGLIEIGRGTQDTRRTALFDELIPLGSYPAEVKVVVQKLADARLITTDEQAGKYTVTISHETLIEAWPWLQKLVHENREIIALQNEIASDAKAWEDHHRDASYLYRGARLASAREQLEVNKILLSGLAKTFIEASVKAHADELEVTRHRANELRRRSVYLTGALVAALIAVGVAIFFSFQSRRQAQIAVARQLTAQAQSIVAARDSKQMVAILLATQSMKMFPSSEAAQVLLNNNFAAHPISSMIHNDVVWAVAFSPDGRYVVSGSGDKTARVWEAATGKEVARMSHDDVVRAVTFSPDGRYVVSGSWDKTVRVWEAGTGKEVARMAHDDVVYAVAFSPDGKHVVSGSVDKTARVWEAGTGKEVARMAHDDVVYAVAFSPDGRYVVSGSWDKTARVWEATTGKEVARMSHDDVVYAVVFSPDGRYVVSGSNDATVRVWEAGTGKEVTSMTHDDVVRAVAFSPDGRYVVSGSGDKTARVWEATTGKEVARMSHDSAVDAVAFSPDGRYVASGGNDAAVRAWEATTGKEVARMTHNNPVSAVAFSPDSRYMVSGSWDKTARVWEVGTGKEVARITHDNFVLAVTFSPDSKYVVSGSGDKTVRVWEVGTGKEVARMSHDDFVRAIALSTDGKYLVSASQDKTARVWEAATGKEVARMAHDDVVYAVGFSPDGRYVVSGSGDKTARVWEASTGKEIARMTHDNFVLAVAFSPDGKYVVSGSVDKTARVWEATTGKEVARMTHDDVVRSVAFSSDGKYVISGSGDRSARVWEAGTGKEVSRMTHDDVVRAVAFSPDGKYAVSGGVDKTARVWNASTGKEVARMSHDDVVYAVDFSPDGRYVVSGSWDKSARVWDAGTGKEVARMTHDNPVYTVAFSPDGRYVVSGSGDNTARVWHWEPDKLIEDACGFLPRNLTRAEWIESIGEGLPYQAVCPNLPVEPEVTPGTK